MGRLSMSARLSMALAGFRGKDILAAGDINHAIMPGSVQTGAKLPKATREVLTAYGRSPWLRMVVGRRTQDHNLYLNVVVTDEEPGLLAKVNSCLLEHVDVVDFRRLDSRDGSMQLTYFIECDNAQTVSDLVDDLKRRLPVSEISFLQQEQLLGG